MDSRKFVLRQTGVVALGVAVGVAVMWGIFALLHRFDTSVLLGGLVGGALAVGNFFALSVVATLASDRAVAQDVAGGKKLMQSSYPIRMLVLVAVLFICAKSGYFNVIALALPLVFVRPAITLAEFFRK